MELVALLHYMCIYSTQIDVNVPYQIPCRYSVKRVHYIDDTRRQKHLCVNRYYRDDLLRMKNYRYA